MKAWFRCRHKKTSLPITRRRKGTEMKRIANSYVICLSCGEQIPYSFSESRMVQERRRPRMGEASMPGFHSLA